MPDENRTLYDIAGAVSYLHRVGASAATTTFVRSLINSGTLPHLKIGKAFYVSRASIDSWLAKAEKRNRG
jgi:hypothetical protein